MQQPAIAERVPSIIPFRQPGEDSGLHLLTLCEVYERYVEPEQFDNAPATRSDYRTSLRRWRSSTGNPPVCDIDDATMQAFRDSFPPSMSAKTVQKHLKNIGRVLRRCGPYDPYNNREGMDLISRIPWCKPPRWKKADRKRVNRIISLQRMDAIYRNCSVMDWPSCSSIPAPLFWRVVLAVEWYCGPSIEDLFSFRFGTHVLFDPECPDPEIDAVNPHGWIHYARRKTDIELFVPISAVVRAHFDRIYDGRRKLVFPITKRPNSWMKARHQLQRGLFDRPYTFQEMRKTANNNWKRFGHELGPAVVGHKVPGVNAQWYTNQVAHVLSHVADYEYPPAMLAIL